MERGASTGTGARFDVVDAARGVAIAAMIVFHAAWDLSFLRLIPVEVSTDPGWQAFAKAIAGSFLALVGVGLVLGHGQGVRWKAFGRRLATIAAAAVAVSVATYAAFPDSFVYFGILHAIAASSVLALPFLRLPAWACALVACAVLALPEAVSSPAFDSRWLAWIGFSETPPRSNDFEPIFPWFGMVLIGVAAAKVALASAARDRLAAWRCAGPLSRLLVRAGRWSLLIYLAHQPILLGVLFPVAKLVGPHPAAEAAGFMRACQASCRDGGRGADECRRGCACVVHRSKTQGLWAGVLSGEMTPDDTLRVQALANRCFLDEGRP